MSLILCKNCGKQMSSFALRCPHCDNASDNLSSQYEVKEFTLFFENTYDISEGMPTATNGNALFVLSEYMGGIQMIFKVDPSKGIEDLIEIRIKDGLIVSEPIIPGEVVPVLMYVLSEPQITFDALWQSKKIVFTKNSIYRNRINEIWADMDEAPSQANNGKVVRICDGYSICFERNRMYLVNYKTHKETTANIDVIKKFSDELFDYVEKIMSLKYRR